MKRIFIVLSFTLVALTVPALAQDPCAGSRDLKLTNGKIHTLDKKDTIVSEVTIQNGKFTAVGPAANQRAERKRDSAQPQSLSPCTKTINLRGRTVVPGLIDNHNHIVLLGMRPGHDIRIETAASIADIQSILKDKAKTVKPGEFITTLGDWNMKQFAEKRVPALAELDQALPAHPYLMNGEGGTVTNSLGKKFFESKGIAVTPTGVIANADFLKALNALRAIQTFDDMKRGTTDAINYVLGFGLTTNVDMGAFNLPGTPDLQDSAVADTVESLNQWTMYDAFLALHREGKVNTRLRIFFLTQDTRPDVPILKQRLLNTFPNFGDDMIRTAGIGEFATQWGLRGGGSPPNYQAALQLIAKYGWAFQQHTLSLAEDQFATSTFEKVNTETPIRDLRWSLAHVPRIDRPTIDRLKAMGAGIAVHGWLYLSGSPGNGGPPYRTILDSGIHVGAGSDAAAVSVFDPWLEIYYMVTGKNSAGELINDGQQLTRMEALRLYTSENGWFLKEEDKLGTIETGKLGDLIVLSDDYFDSAKVSDEGLKKLKSVLTIVDGKVVHDSTK
ncbi:MAG TPA: amidohydrolase family protein [Terriglobia bacterium]|nr:amidohydrolase family protein [Terriglobia bacterium]